MPEQKVLFLYQGLWIVGTQISGEEATRQLEQYAEGFRCDVDELLLFKNCQVQASFGRPYEQPFLVIRRSVIDGLFLDQLT